MNSTEPKRRGRPPRDRSAETVPAVAEVEPEVEPEVEAVNEAPARPAKPSTPCWRCGEPLQRSTMLLRAYGMAVLRCPRCRHVAVENDPRGEWRDEETAKTGRPPAIVARAAAIYAERHPFTPIPAAPASGADAAIQSEWADIRWNEFEL